MVLVSHTHRFVFLKTRKTASTSVEMYLERWCRPPGARITERTRQRKSPFGIVGARMTGHGNLVYRRLFPWRNHMSAGEIRRRLGAERWERYAKVTTMRDPFDKVLSEYLWSTGQAMPATWDELAAFRRGFTGHLRAHPGNNDHKVLHVDGRYAADLTIRYERLADDLAETCTRLGLDWQAHALPHTKRTRPAGSPPLAAFYDPEAVAIVRDRYGWIFDRFGYAAEPGAPPQAAAHDITGAT